MTKRLYYDDQYLREFHAQVVDRQADERGPRVALNQTAFYPEGGGQPADLGVLNGVAVRDVQVMDDGQVWHWTETQIMQKAVRGEIDWHRRFDHMQQHHGQHLLSAAFENLFGYSTTSFHLGTRRVTIDIATKTVTEVEARRAEEEANNVIWDNRSVHARFVSATELANLPLRKQPSVAGPIRVVSVPDFDHSPCGGTHPNATGAVGIIHVSKLERRGEETRVEFACGNRLLKTMHSQHDILRALSNVLTVGTHELEDAVVRLRDSESANRRAVDAAKKELQRLELEAIMKEIATGESPGLVCKRYDDRPVAELQTLAQDIAARDGIAILGTATDRAQVVMARPANSDLDCAHILRTALAAVGGGGGGRPALASGGLPDPAKLDAVLASIRSDVSRAFDR